MTNSITETFLSNLNTGDIVEVTCAGFYHYCIYLGAGLCAHITNKESCETAHAVENFCAVVGHRPLRVCNFEEKAKQLGLVKRDIWQIWDVATEGLERDINGEPKAGVWRNVQDNRLYNNSEVFVTYCRYDCPSGWSEQDENIWKALTGSLSTVTNAALSNCARVLHDDNVPNVVKAVVAVAAPVYAAADIAVGTISDVLNPVTSTVKNINRQGGIIERDREATEGKYETGLGIGYKAETTRDSVEAHWSVLSAGLSSASASTESYIGLDGVCAEVKAEMARGEVSVGPVNVGVGLQVDSGVCVKKGKIGASLLGFGAEVGEGGVKVKTPVVDASCCIA